MQCTRNKLQLLFWLLAGILWARVNNAVLGLLEWLHTTFFTCTLTTSGPLCIISLAIHTATTFDSFSSLLQVCIGELLISFFWEADSAYSRYTIVFIMNDSTHACINCLGVSTASYCNSSSSSSSSVTMVTRATMMAPSIRRQRRQVTIINLAAEPRCAVLYQRVMTLGVPLH